MSWQEKLQSDLIIVTGDGKEYRPLWKSAQKAKEYNISEFDFINTSGTLVDRRKPKGRKFPLEIYFQGENHLDLANDFENSADDERAWNISHPFYGNIICHPTSLTFDNTGLNISKITGTLFETITNDRPKSTVSPVDKIKEDKEILDNVCVETFSNTVSPTASDVSDMADSTNQLYSQGQTLATGDDALKYFDLLNTANSAISQAISYPANAISAVQSLINAPALFVDSIKSRIDLLQNQFETLRNTLTSIFSPNEKRIYQSQSLSLVSSMALAASTPQTQDDYGNAESVLDIAEILLNNYNNLLSDLDGLQTDNGGLPDSYIPDAEPLILLNELISFTVSSMFDIALNAKQERAIILEEDSNAILLTHRFYGLDSEDELLSYFISTNNIGLNELLHIRKGRKIYYYI